MDYKLKTSNRTKTKVCGCCLSKTNLIMLSNQLYKHISLCFSIEISNYSPNELSAFICNTCKDKVQDCYKFRSQILDSQVELINIENVSKATSNFNSKTTAVLDDPLSSDDLDCSDNDNFEVQNQNTKCVSMDMKLESKIVDINIKKEINSNLEINTAPKEKVNDNIISRETDEISSTIYQNENMTCEICKKKFGRFRQFQIHKAMHFPNLMCHVCGKPFASKKNLYIHLRTHEPSVTCTICKKTLKPYYLRKHMKNHSEIIKQHSCRHCFKRFMTITQRLRHMESVHNVDIYKFHCKSCSKKFFLSNQLSHHIRRCHFKELNFACDVCGKAFYTSVECKQHMVTHTGERNHRCDACPKSFTKRWSLIVHMRTHAGNVIKHKCPICSKEFTQKCSLRGHLKNIHEKHNA